MRAAKVEGMPGLKTTIDSDLKDAFADLARQQGVSESVLLGALVTQFMAMPTLARKKLAQQLAASQFKVLPYTPMEKAHGGRQVKIRLWADEQKALERLAAAEGITVPGWIVSLVRRTALDAVPFSPVELRAMQEVVRELGPIGRNLNTVVRHWYATGEMNPHVVEVMQLREYLAALRKEVRDVVDRVRERYTPSDDA